MIRLLLFLVMTFLVFQIGGIIQKKYLPEKFLENAVEKAVEIGGDTCDALSLVYEMHKPEGE